MTKPFRPALLTAACALIAACGGSSPPSDSAAQSSATSQSGSTPSTGSSGANAQPKGSGTSSAQPASGPATNTGSQAPAAGSSSTPGTASDPQNMANAAAAADPNSAAAAGAASTKPARVIPPGSVSKPGEYSGYGDKIYSGYALSSQYVAMRDGTKLAVDLYRPKEKDGTVTEAPLPVLWMHTPYNRRYFASTAGAGLAGEVYPGAAALLVEYGYVAAVVDYRGVYASYGKNEGYNRGEWVDGARLDAYDITEWFAEQPWSNGKVGMWGCSATGGSQMQALTTAPPHLKAIFPMSCEFDAYPFGVPGGMSPASGTTKAPPGG